MDGGDHPTPSQKKPVFQRSASFSASTHRAALPPPPPLSISRPSFNWSPSITSSSSNSAAPDSVCRRRELDFFDRECSRVEDHLYLGSDVVARDRECLRLHGITHVLSCVGSPELFRPDIKYMTLWLSDTPGQDITAVLYDVFDYFEEVRKGGRKVLVHCSRGVSRSAALVVAYLMWKHALPFDASLRKVRAVRPVTDPNLGFASQLLSFQNRILCSVDTPSYRSRLYRMAPHSAYAPLHIVPKPLDHHPSPADLDSRGTFVVEAASAVYVWIGSNSEVTMACGAKAAASQFVRYEHVVKPILDVNEGSEPADFWDSFENCSERYLSVGNRKVEAYNFDFELFLKAIGGGVVPPFTSPVESASPTRMPCKGGGWLWLKQRLLAGGVKDLIGCCGMPSLEDRELEPFGSSQSPVSRDLSTPTSSDFSTLSPASSLSDWCNSPSSGSEFFYDGEMLLLSSRKGKVPPPTRTTSLSRHRGDFASSRGLSSCQEEIDDRDIFKDWSFSPLRLAEEDSDRMIEIEQPASLDADEENCATLLALPALYQWPEIAKLEDLHPGVLDSKSVFLLLARESSLRKQEHIILYVWVGRQYELRANSGTNNEPDPNYHFQKIGHDFLHQMGFAMGIPVQVVREEQEPQQFLSHFFTFHKAKEI